MQWAWLPMRILLLMSIHPQVQLCVLISHATCVMCRENVGQKDDDDNGDDDDEVITSESEAEAEKAADGSESDDCRPQKRKLKLTEFPDLLAKRHKAFQKYR